MSDYIVHKAVELSKVKAKRRKELEQPNYLEENFIAQPKYDGCNMVTVAYTDEDGDQRFEFLSRTGELVRSCDHIEAAMRVWPGGFPDGVYLGEAWCPDAEFADISGWFRRQATDADTCRLQFVIFDVLTLDEWEAGESTVPYESRALRIGDISYIPQGQAPFWSAGCCGRIAEAWKNTTAQDVADKLVEAGGYDGLILRDPAGLWRKGDRGTGGEIIKVKNRIRVTLRVVGYEEGEGKHAGRIGALVCYYNGKEQRVGTGLTDKQREDWMRELPALVEVEAMGLSKDGLLREPRLKGVRSDVVEAD